MSTYAFPKYQYAVWDGTNVAEIQEFVARAFVADDGSLQYPGPPGVGVLITDTVGTYVVGNPGGIIPTGVFGSEAEFAVQYSAISS